MAEKQVITANAIEQAKAAFEAASVSLLQKLADADVDINYISYTSGQLPSTSGAIEGTIGAYFTGQGNLQKVRLEGGDWNDVGEPLSSVDFTTEKAAFRSTVDRRRVNNAIIETTQGTTYADSVFGFAIWRNVIYFGGHSAGNSKADMNLHGALMNSPQEVDLSSVKKLKDKDDVFGGVGSFYPSEVFEHQGTLYLYLEMQSIGPNGEDSMCVMTAPVDDPFNLSEPINVMPYTKLNANAHAASVIVDPEDPTQVLIYQSATNFSGGTHRIIGLTADIDNLTDPSAYTLVKGYDDPVLENDINGKANYPHVEFIDGEYWLWSSSQNPNKQNRRAIYLTKSKQPFVDFKYASPDDAILDASNIVGRKDGGYNTQPRVHGNYLYYGGRAKFNGVSGYNKYEGIFVQDLTQLKLPKNPSFNSYDVNHVNINYKSNKGINHKIESFSDNPLFFPTKKLKKSRGSIENPEGLKGGDIVGIFGWEAETGGTGQAGSSDFVCVVDLPDGQDVDPTKRVPTKLQLRVTSTNGERHIVKEYFSGGSQVSYHTDTTDSANVLFSSLNGISRKLQSVNNVTGQSPKHKLRRSRGNDFENPQPVQNGELIGIYGWEGMPIGGASAGTANILCYVDGEPQQDQRVPSRIDIEVTDTNGNRRVVWSFNPDGSISSEAGATGSFTAQSGETVTVEGGIITDIN